MVRNISVQSFLLFMSKINLDELSFELFYPSVVYEVSSHGFTMEGTQLLAYYGENRVGILEVGRIIEYNENFRHFNFHFDSTFNPAKQIPSVMNIDVRDDFQENGIAGKMLDQLNGFYQSLDCSAIHSSGLSSEKACKMWEMLVAKGKAIRVDAYNGRPRWKVL